MHNKWGRTERSREVRRFAANIIRTEKFAAD